MRTFTDPSKQHRFPGAPEKAESIRFHVLNPIAKGKADPDDCLVFVRDFLRKAKELVKEFEDIANTFGRRAAAERRLQQMALNQARQMDPARNKQPSSNQNQQMASNQSPQLAFRPRSTSFAPPPPKHGDTNADTSVPASKIHQIPKPIPVSKTAPQLSSNEASHSHNAQRFQDDSTRDDVENLLVLSELNIPPHKRKQTPKQMSCALTEHQKIGLTWLLEQEMDRQKKGGLLAGL